MLQTIRSKRAEISLKDGRLVLRLCDALTSGGADKVKTAWLNLPVYLQQQIASLLVNLGRDGDLREIIGSWPNDTTTASRPPSLPMWED
jgi:hypothetical protein